MNDVLFLVYVDFVTLTIIQALYLEFYKKYAMYLEKNNYVDTAREVLSRATAVFLKRKPQSFVALAEFEEANGNSQVAENIFSELIKGKGKGHVETVLHFINFYRRQDRIDDALNLFTTLRADIDKSSLPFYDVQHAYFVRKYGKDYEKARNLYAQAVQDSPASRFAWLAWIEFEISHSSDDAAICNIFEQAISQSDELDRDDRLLVMDRYLNYLQNHSSVTR
jgi:pre-mRNA-processing factor 39